MAYEIQIVDSDTCTITDGYGDQMMHVITIETEPGVFVQRSVMKRRMAQRVVRALQLYETLARSVLAERESYAPM